MNLGFLGYMLTVVNLNAIGGNKSQLKDLSVITDKVSILKEHLLKYPDCKIEYFNDNDYCRKGDIAVFVSKNLRDYIKNNVDSKEDGVIVILFFEDSKTAKSLPAENLFILLRNEDLDETTAKLVLQYINETQKDFKAGVYLNKIQEQKVSISELSRSVGLLKVV